MSTLNYRPCIGWSAVILSVLILAAFCIPAVAADDTGGILMPGAKNFDLILSDGLTKYFKFEGGGLNALHITTDPDDAYGQTTTSDEQSGVFYFSETGGRGFFDDMILMIAVNGTIPDDFAVHIRASGYRWTPTPLLNQPPTADDLEYIDGSYEGTITKSDFMYRPQTWKPAGDNAPGNYPIYYGQDMSETSNTFHTVFVDLNAGIIGENSMIPDLIDSGSMKIEFEFENLETFAAFNSYGWCNQSNQGQGISWTNRVSGLESSGYTVLGTGSSGDTAAGGSGGDGGGSATSGYAGEEISSGISDTFNGTLAYLPVAGAPAALEPGSTASLTVPVAGVNGTVRNAIMYLFVSGSHYKDTSSGVDPALEFMVNGRSVTPVRTLTGREGGTDGPVSVTYAVDLGGMIAGSGDLAVTVRDRGRAGALCTLSGGVLLLAVENPDAPSISYEVAEVCDAVAVDTGAGVYEEDAQTVVFFSGPPDMNRISESRLVVFGTGDGERDGTQDRIILSEREWTGAFNRSGMLWSASLEAGSYLFPGENEVSVGTGAAASSGGALVNRIIVLEYSGGPVERGEVGVTPSAFRITKTFLIDNPVVSRVVLSLPAGGTAVWVTAADRADALTAPAPGTVVYRYVEFDLDGAAAASTPATITFRVPEEWLTEMGFGPETIVLLRFADGQWSPLSTRVMTVGDGYAGYAAESDGLSLFAVAARTTPDPTPSPAIIDEAVSPVSTAPRQSPLLPLLPLIAALVGFILTRRE